MRQLASPGSSVAATTNGAAEEKSPGTSTSPRREPLGRPDATTRDCLRSTRAPAAAQHQLGVVARRQRLDDGRPARPRRGPRAGRTTSPARSRPAARSGSRAARRLRSTSGGRPSAVSTRAPISASGVGDAVHRPAPQRLVAGQLEAAALAGEEPGEQAQRASRSCRSRSAPPARASPRRPDALDPHGVDVVVVARSTPSARTRRDRSPPCRPSGRSRGSTVSPSPIAPSSTRPVRDRLVAGDARCAPRSAVAGSILIARAAPARRRRRSPAPRAAPPRGAPRPRRRRAS